MTLSGTVVPVPFGSAGIQHRRGEYLEMSSAVWADLQCDCKEHSKSHIPDGAPASHTLRCPSSHCHSPGVGHLFILWPGSSSQALQPCTAFTPKDVACVCSTCLGSRWTQGVLHRSMCQPQHPMPSIPKLHLHHLGTGELKRRSRLSCRFSSHSRETMCGFLARVCLCVEDSFLLA